MEELTEIYQIFVKHVWKPYFGHMFTRKYILQLAELVLVSLCLVQHLTPMFTLPKERVFIITIPTVLYILIISSTLVSTLAETLKYRIPNDVMAIVNAPWTVSLAGIGVTKTHLWLLNKPYGEDTRISFAMMKQSLLTLLAAVVFFLDVVHRLWDDQALKYVDNE